MLHDYSRGAPCAPKACVESLPGRRKKLRPGALHRNFRYWGDKSFADDLNMERGIVSGRVALLLRSTEIRPPVPTICPAPAPLRVSFVFRFGIFAFVSFRFGFRVVSIRELFFLFCFLFHLFFYFLFFEVFRWVEGLPVADAPGRPAGFF